MTDNVDARYKHADKKCYQNFGRADVEKRLIEKLTRGYEANINTNLKKNTLLR